MFVHSNDCVVKTTKRCILLFWTAVGMDVQSECANWCLIENVI